MEFRGFTLVLAVFVPLGTQADPLFGKDMASDRDLPAAWGVGFDSFHISQPLEIDTLTVTTPPGFPPLPVNNGAGILTESKVRNNDIKVDVWVFPFLNLFGLYGELDGATEVDLTGTGIPLPPDLNRIRIDYDGDVYGGGVVLAFGGDEWFGSLAATFTDTDLSGDFSSSVKATTLQPRLGLRYGDGHEFWVGGYWIDAEEDHTGSVNIDFGPGVGIVPIGFDVSLSQEQDFSLSIGTHLTIGRGWEATVEVGGGDRRTALGNITYRFE